MPRSLVDRYKCFGAGCCLHLQGRKATWRYTNSDNRIALHVGYFFLCYIIHNTEHFLITVIGCLFVCKFTNESQLRLSKMKLLEFHRCRVGWKAVSASRHVSLIARNSSFLKGILMYILNTRLRRKSPDSLQLSQ